jgi:hypothetical protein
MARSPSASVVPSTVIAAAMPCRDREAGIGGSRGTGAANTNRLPLMFPCLEAFSIYSARLSRNAS